MKSIEIIKLYLFKQSLESRFCIISGCLSPLCAAPANCVSRLSHLPAPWQGQRWEALGKLAGGKAGRSGPVPALPVPRPPPRAPAPLYGPAEAAFRPDALNRGAGSVLSSS